MRQACGCIRGLYETHGLKFIEPQYQEMAEPGEFLPVEPVDSCRIEVIWRDGTSLFVICGILNMKMLSYG